MDWKEITEGFNYLHNDKIFDIQEINFWIELNRSLYIKENKLLLSKYWHQLSDGQIVRLPPKTENIDKNNFLEVYEELEIISEFHTWEKYFKMELSGFDNIRKSRLKLKEWLLKNEKIGSDKFCTFLLDYLDYDDDPDHLNVYVPSSKSFEIFINKNDFKYTLEFLFNFNKYYW